MSVKYHEIIFQSIKHKEISTKQPMFFGESFTSAEFNKCIKNVFRIPNIIENLQNTINFIL